MHAVRDGASGTGYSGMGAARQGSVLLEMFCLYLGSVLPRVFWDLSKPE